jgi:tetrahydromethanopterin S-methyltransferase subunit A
MCSEYYPWPGDFTKCSSTASVAVVLLSTDYIPKDTVAIYGSVKTENIGLEKIIANVISNPHIRFLVLCGKDIRGHFPGASLSSLHKLGIDDHNKIIDAPGAIPYIENLSREAIERFRDQVSIIDLMDIPDKSIIDTKIHNLLKTSPGPFGDSYIAIKIKASPDLKIDDKRALHSKIVFNWKGKVSQRK